MTHPDSLLIHYAQTRDQKARTDLVMQYQNLIRYAATRFAGPSESLDDLVQVGNIGLINALDRYDPTQNVRFSTYALCTIYGEIKRHFRDKTWSVKVPRRLQELSLRARAANQALTSRLGRGPTPREVAEEIGVTEEEALEALEVGRITRTISLDAPTAGTAGDEHGAFSELFGRIDPGLYDLETFADLRWAIETLDPDEGCVIRMRFFEDMSQTQIAQRLSISQMQVSRMEKRALRRMKTLLRDGADVATASGA